MTSARDHRIGILFVTISAVAWSLAGYFTRLIPLDSFTLLAWRGVFGATSLFLVILIIHRGNWWRQFARFGWPELSYVALTTMGMIMFITSLGHTSVAHGAVIYATIPFIAAFMGWLFLKEYPSRTAMISAGFAISGVIVMVGLGADGGLLGDVLALGMTICMGFSIILLRRFPAMGAIPSACVGALISIPICWPLGNPWGVTEVQLLQLALFGLVNSAVGLVCFAVGSKKIPAVETALIGALDTPLAPLWVWLAFNERPGWNTVLGGSIVFAAVVGHIVMSQRKMGRLAVAG